MLRSEQLHVIDRLLVQGIRRLKASASSSTIRTYLPYDIINGYMSDLLEIADQIFKALALP